MLLLLLLLLLPPPPIALALVGEDELGCVIDVGASRGEGDLALPTLILLNDAQPEQAIAGRCASGGPCGPRFGQTRAAPAP